MHYKRWYKTGDPLGVRPRHPPAPERFWAKVIRSEGCWEWTGALSSNSYGNFCPSFGQWVPAHRYSWEMAYGPVSEGAWVLHRCDNPRCVRPEHLFLGTHQANVDDMHLKRRHMHGERHWLATLTDDQVAEIRNRLTGQRGELVRLAQEYGVSRTTIKHFRDYERRSGRTHFPV